MTAARTRLATVADRLAHVGADPGDDADARQRKSLLVLISLLILPIAVLWGVLYLSLGSTVGYVPLLYALILLAAVAVFARTGDFGFLLHVNLLDILLAPTLSMIPLGGFLGSAGVGLWAILAPMGALVFGGVRASIGWYVAFVAVFLASGVAGEVLGSVSTVPAWFTTAMLGLNVVGAGTIVFTLLAVFAKQRQDALVARQAAQQRADDLLLDILPRRIAERLKSRPETIVDRLPAVSILFADVVDFTPRTEHLPPADIVGILDHLFGHFDTIAERYGLERIKTIGDCYMIAGGVPDPRPDHAEAIGSMALDMLESIHARDEVGHLGLELRIGIDSGPVVAGVIGRKRFLYDLWGDSVNTASRMESHGAPGRIQVTRETYELLKDRFEFIARGTVAVKGKGSMETWFLVGRRSGGASGGGGRSVS